LFFDGALEGRKMQGSYEVWKLFLPAVLSGLLAWLYASLTKVSKNEHKESLERVEKLIEKQSDRNSRFEAELNNKVSRAELKESMHDLKDSIQQMRAELKEDFQNLRAELRKAN
jgi:septal ring factor EnvC (AmiA/AmiB activator)